MTAPTKYQRVRDQYDVYEAGQPHIWFPRFGGDDWLGLGVSSVDGVDLLCEAGRQWLLAFAFRATGTGFRTIVARCGGTSTARTMQLYVNDSNGYLKGFARGVAFDLAAYSVVDNKFHVGYLYWDGSTLKGALDGAAELSLAVGTAAEETTETITIGARTATAPADFFTGDIVPPMLRPGEHSLAVRQRIMRALAAEYGVTLA